MILSYIQDEPTIGYGVWYRNRNYLNYAFIYRRQSDGWIVMSARSIP